MIDLTADDDDITSSSQNPIGRETLRREAMLSLLSTAQVIEPPRAGKARGSAAAPAPASGPKSSAPKRVKMSDTSQPIYVLVKGDWPRSASAKLVNIKVLGTYSSQALADAAKDAYLQRGGWEEGYGYHQGYDAESRIEVYRSVLDAPAR